MSAFNRCLILVILLSPVACSRAADTAEMYELHGPPIQMSLELRADGSAIFNREITDGAGAVSKFHSKSGTWTQCKSAPDKATSVPSALEKTKCFVVEVKGTDEQGETQFGILFVRKGDALTQMMEDGTAFVLARRSSSKN